MNKKIQSFAPVAAKNSRLLILGSMPGEASLQASQYYAHPRNLFWPIVCALVDIDAETPYEGRIAAIRSARIALWDVLASCERAGSLDAAISRASRVPNDFVAFLAAHRAITHVFFNGAEAEQSFMQLVRPALADRKLVYRRLPSTSPAHAALTRKQKLAAWRAILSVKSTIRLAASTNRR